MSGVGHVTFTLAGGATLGPGGSWSCACGVINPAPYPLTETVTLRCSADSDPVTAEQILNAIELRVEHATEGLWQFGSAPIDPGRAAREAWLAETCSDGDSPLWATWVLGDRGPDDVVIPAVTGDGEQARANAEFIAHAHDDVRAMAAALFKVLGLVANVGNEATGPEFVACYEIRDAIDAALMRGSAA